MRLLDPVDLPTLEQVLDSSPLTVLADTLVIDAIALMNLASSSAVDCASDFGSCVLVVEENNLVGIFTLQDVVRLTGVGTDLSRVKISEVMTQPVISLTLAPNQNALSALSFMRQHHIRHLPVVDAQGQLVGLITQGRIRQVIQPAHLLKLRSVTDVMVTEVIQALPNTSVLELCQMMSDRQISCVVIVAPQETALMPVGMITEKDIAKVQLQGRDIAQTQAQSVMSSPVFSISPHESLWTVHHLMQERGVRRLTVVGEQGELQGLLTQTNLLQVLDPIEIVSLIQALQAKLEEQTVQLRQTNQLLAQEVRQRRQVEESLHQSQQDLELRVARRTAELVKANVRLQQEIEERQKIEITLQQRNYQWQALFDHALEAIAIVDDQGQYIDVNPAACNLFGVSREELLGSTIADFAAPGFDMSQVWQQFCEQGQMSGEFSLHRPDGTVRETEFAAVANFIPHRHLSILRDISDVCDELRLRKQAEVALRASEQTLQAIINNCAVAIYMIDPENRHLLVNRCYAELLATTPENTLGKSIYEFWPSEAADRFAAHNQQVLTTNQLSQLEEVVPQADGLHTYITVKFPLCDTAGKPYAVAGISTDITERKRAEQALQQSERKLRAVFDSTFEFMGLLTTEGIVIDANRTALNIVAANLSDVIGQPFWETPWWVHFPEQQSRLQQAIARAANGEFVRMETKHIWADGTQAFVDFTLKPIFDEAGTVVMLVPEGRDITERKQSELEISKFVSLVDNCTEFIGMCDHNFLPFYVNPAGMQLVGLNDIHQYRETPVREFFFPEDQDLIINEFFPRVLREGRAEVEIRFRHFQTGEALWMVYSVSCVKDPNDQLIGLATISRNISDRKLAEQKIAEQAALIDIATDAIFVRDLANRILFWSRGAQSLYGWTAEESLGKNVDEFFSQETPSRLKVALQATIEQGSWQGELEQITKTGQKIIVASRWTLVHNLFGQPQSILVVNTDITEKKQLEQQFYRAQRLESVGTLASGIAHDLNNVFSPIVMIAQLLPLRCKNVDARTQELFKTLETSSKRGADLVKQILTFARGTEGKRILLQPGHLLKELVKVIKQTFPKSIEISTDIPTNTLWMVQADPTQLDQVFMNLAVNARDAMPSGGRLTITAENRMIDATYARMRLEAQAGNYIVVTFSDTGTGIAPEILERIFDPFFTTKEVGKGTGLGLSTVLGIVKNHGGFLEVVSQVGKGTQFRVFLPKANGIAAAATTERELPRGKGELILVVDDEAVVQQTTQETLADYNYKTLVANDGIEAIALYVKYRSEISAVLLDLLMPNMDGLTAIRTLKTLNPNVKIVATSGLPANEQTALAVGAKKFLSKPYTAQDLLTTLSAALRVEE